MITSRDAEIFDFTLQPQVFFRASAIVSFTAHKRMEAIEREEACFHCRQPFFYFDFSIKRALKKRENIKNMSKQFLVIAKQCII